MKLSLLGKEEREREGKIRGRKERILSRVCLWRIGDTRNSRDEATRDDALKRKLARPREARESRGGDPLGLLVVLNDLVDAAWSRESASQVRPRDTRTWESVSQSYPGSEKARVSLDARSNRIKVVRLTSARLKSMAQKYCSPRRRRFDYFEFTVYFECAKVIFGELTGMETIFRIFLFKKEMIK